MQILVTLDRMLCARPDSRWYFFRATMGGDGVPETSVICKGSMAWQPGEMETLALIGDWTVYKGERQFQFRTAKLTLPLDPRGQLHYVCRRAHGIGPAMEEAIWDKLGNDWQKLRSGEIRKMSAAAYRSFIEQTALFNANSEKAEIISYLENKGCTEAMAAAAFDAWGKDAAGVVNSNCFRLAELPGFSFKTVDENVRRNFDIADDDPRRIHAGIVYGFEVECADGSTALDCWRHFTACQKLLPNIGNELIVSEVQNMVDQKLLYIFDSKNMLTTKKCHAAEKIIADYISGAKAAEKDQFTMPNDEFFASGEKFIPDESQLAAVRFAVQEKISVINGGAGVGKTTVIKMIVRGVKKCFPHLQCRLCAPTGKAAARLKEASGIEATTIHVLLGAQGDGRFSGGMLNDTTVIIDESSMVDSALLAEVLKRRPAKIVLVGDQAQLTPVGAGQPFHDIIELHPNLVRTLTKCYRNTEAVFQAASLIRSGNLPKRHAESENERWTVVPVADPAEVQQIVCDWAKNGILDFSTDIVLCPKNGTKDQEDKFQAATVNAFNEDLLMLDRSINGRTGTGKFIPGDRVINTVNNPDHHVWNGTTGTVHAVDSEGLFVTLDVPFRDDVTGEMVDCVRFNRDMIRNLRYAYALTIHKSQGSQYRKVIIAIISRDKFQLSRSLIYTGVTRTQKECVVIGDSYALEHGISVQTKKNSVLQCLQD